MDTRGQGARELKAQADAEPPRKFDADRVLKMLESRLGAKSHVDPDEMARLLKRGGLYEQRQMPSNMPAPGAR